MSCTVWVACPLSCTPVFWSSPQAGRPRNRPPSSTVLRASNSLVDSKTRSPLLQLNQNKLRDMLSSPSSSVSSMSSSSSTPDLIDELLIMRGHASSQQHRSARSGGVTRVCRVELGGAAADKATERANGGRSALRKPGIGKNNIGKGDHFSAGKGPDEEQNDEVDWRAGVLTVDDIIEYMAPLFILGLVQWLLLYAKARIERPGSRKQHITITAV